MKEAYIKFLRRFVAGFIFPSENLFGNINNLLHFIFFCRKTSRFTCSIKKSLKIDCISNDFNLLKQFQYLCIKDNTSSEWLKAYKDATGLNSRMSGRQSILLKDFNYV